MTLHRLPGSTYLTLALMLFTVDDRESVPKENFREEVALMIQVEVVDAVLEDILNRFGIHDQEDRILPKKSDSVT